MANFIFPEVSPPPKNPENSGLELHLRNFAQIRIWDASHHAATVLPGILESDFFEDFLG